MSDATATEKQHFHLGEFDGPLDLLLFLIKKSEVNIYDIPIASITEQYLSYLGFATKVDLDTMTEFYLMAATLLYIKSRMLLPVELDLDDELEDPRKELVEKLIEYQKFRKLSDLMTDREGEVEWIIERTQSQRILPFSDEGIWEQVSVWDLLQTFSLAALDALLGADHRPVRGGQRQREDHADRTRCWRTRASSCSRTCVRDAHGARGGLRLLRGARAGQGAADHGVPEPAVRGHPHQGAGGEPAAARQRTARTAPVPRSQRPRRRSIRSWT